MMESAHANTVPPFLSKTYDMVDDPSTNSVVSWSSSDNSFVVWNVPEFQMELLPKYFKHSNFSSFVRQLNTYVNLHLDRLYLNNFGLLGNLIDKGVDIGFRKVDPDRFEFANEGFLRGQKHLLKTISRKKPLHVQGNQSPQVQSAKIAACIEVGKFGLEEEVEGLKLDKNVLMQELVRLRQKQQDTDNQLQTVGQRVHVMEQRQQQMMSFLAKAMQNPGFLNQFVQQKNENNRHIGGSKKRRLPGQEEENSVGKVGSNSPKGQIVKFRSSMNEAAKAMLHQILKMNSSSRLEPSINNSGPFLLDNLPSSGVLDSSTSSRISELMLPEVQPASEPSLFPVESGFSVNHPSSAISEVQSSSCLVTDHVKTDQIADLKVHNSGQDTILSNYPLREGFMPGSSVEIPDVNFVSSNALNVDNVSPPTSVLDVEMPLETDAFLPNQESDVMVDGNPNLPRINDSFWEQFLTASQLTGDMDEITSSTPETHMTREQEFQSWPENSWDNIHRMNHLTEQMELLASESRMG